VVGLDFCKMIRDVFVDPAKVEKVNKTFITLIPKKDEVCFVKDFKSISLCNVIYKALTRIIAHPFQSSFMPNRQSGDNIIVTQEIFHSMRRKTGKKGWMAIKIDLEKTYDKLKWDFVRDTL